ncbi:MAG: hypothetical protein ABH863_00245 [Candidatus Micrarchaeota archaeon]
MQEEDKKFCISQIIYPKGIINAAMAPRKGTKKTFVEFSPSFAKLKPRNKKNIIYGTGIRYQICEFLSNRSGNMFMEDKKTITTQKKVIKKPPENHFHLLRIMSIIVTDRGDKEY